MENMWFLTFLSLPFLKSKAAIRKDIFVCPDMYMRIGGEKPGIYTHLFFYVNEVTNTKRNQGDESTKYNVVGMGVSYTSGYFNNRQAEGAGRAGHFYSGGG
jgi:hypothetical protein